jgi:hypothetical protein
MRFFYTPVGNTLNLTPNSDPNPKLSFQYHVFLTIRCQSIISIIPRSIMAYRQPLHNPYSDSTLVLSVTVTHLLTLIGSVILTLILTLALILNLIVLLGVFNFELPADIDSTIPSSMIAGVGFDLLIFGSHFKVSLSLFLCPCFSLSYPYKHFCGSHFKIAVSNVC